MTQFNIQFTLPELLPRASWKFLCWLHCIWVSSLGGASWLDSISYVVLRQLEKMLLQWVTNRQWDIDLHVCCATGHAQVTISWCQSDLRRKTSVQPNTLKSIVIYYGSVWPPLFRFWFLSMGNVHIVGMSYGSLVSLTSYSEEDAWIWGGPQGGCLQTFFGNLLANIPSWNEIGEMGVWLDREPFLKGSVRAHLLSPVFCSSAGASCFTAASQRVRTAALNFIPISVLASSLPLVT